MEKTSCVHVYCVVHRVPTGSGNGQESNYYLSGMEMEWNNLQWMGKAFYGRGKSKKCGPFTFCRA